METAIIRRQRREARRRHSEMTGAVNCTLNDLLFPVEMRDEPMACNSEYSKMVVGQINGGDFKLNQCSPRYELFPNKDLFPVIEDILNRNNIKYHAHYSHINYVRFYANYVIDDPRYGYTMKGTFDKICPKLTVMHSYNGMTKYKIIFGYYRLVCTNGLTIPVQEMKRYNLEIVGKHTESIKHSFITLNQMLEFFVAEAPLVINATTSKYEQLADRMVENVQDRVKEVLEATKIRIVEFKGRNTIDDILNIINREANPFVNENNSLINLGYNGKVNDWLVYNAINQYINDNKRTIAAPEIKMETDSKVLEYMLENA
jgi:hypothetical protein